MCEIGDSPLLLWCRHSCSRSAESGTILTGRLVGQDRGVEDDGDANRQYRPDDCRYVVSRLVCDQCRECGDRGTLQHRVVPGWCAAGHVVHRPTTVIELLRDG